MIKFTFNITKIGVIPNHKKTGLTNVVHSISFDVTGKDGEFSHTIHRSIGISNPNNIEFTELNNLTEYQLINLIKNSFAIDDMQIIENEIQEAIDKQKNTDKSSMEICWPLNTKH
jgi:hypothetical protein